MLSPYSHIALTPSRINPGQVFWQVEENNCPGKADLLFLYGAHADRAKIEAIINGDRFFGVLYRLRNQYAFCCETRSRFL